MKRRWTAKLQYRIDFTVEVEADDCSNALSAAREKVLAGPPVLRNEMRQLDYDLVEHAPPFAHEGIHNKGDFVLVEAASGQKLTQAQVDVALAAAREVAPIDDHWNGVGASSLSIRFSRVINLKRGIALIQAALDAQFAAAEQARLEAEKQ